MKKDSFFPSFTTKFIAFSVTVFCFSVSNLVLLYPQGSNYVSITRHYTSSVPVIFSVYQALATYVYTIPSVTFDLMLRFVLLSKIMRQSPLRSESVLHTLGRSGFLQQSQGVEVC